MEENYATFIKNPKIDKLFGMRDVSIPSKRVDFKRVDAYITDEQGNEEVFNNFYIRKPSSQAVKDFEQLIRNQIKDAKYDEGKIGHPALVEVIICVTVLKKKYFDIDVDNISKTVLDCIKGLLFDDDSQVANLICMKQIHPLNVNSFFIGVTELNDSNTGLLSDVYLFREKNKLSE